MFSTLNKYLYKNYIFGFLVTYSIFSILIFTGDLIEQFRKSTNKDVPIDIIFQLSFYNYFSLIFDTLAIIIFLSCIVTFIKLEKASEYTVMKSSGVKPASLIIAPTILFFIIGIFFITTMNPLTSIMYDKYEKLENQYIKRIDKFATISSNGLWLKQDNEIRKVSNILNAKTIEDEAKIINDFMILEYNEIGSFTGRLDGSKASLQDGYWLMTDVIETPRYSDPIFHKEFKYHTSIVHNDISNSLLSPENISLWQLNNFINLIEKLGYSAIDHKLQLYNLLILPILICSLVLLSYSITSNMKHNDKTINIIIYSIGIIFIFYFFSNLLNALALASHVSPLIAKITLPSALMLLFILTLGLKKQ